MTTHHALSTQTIVIGEDGRTAEASTYFTGVHWGNGKHEGESFNAWGKYDDSLILIEGKGALPGSSGHWVIKKRKLEITKKTGNEGIMWS